MNDLPSEALRRSGETAGSNFSAVRDAIPGLGELALSEVAAGILIPWGEALEWPDWMYQGTSLEPASPIPQRVTVTDDLIIISHFLDRYEYQDLVHSFIFDTFAYSDINGLQFDLAAPNPRAWLQYFAKAANIKNPHFRVAIEEAKGGIELRIASLAEIGKVSCYGEHFAAFLVIRTLSLFQTLLARLEQGHQFSPKLSLRGASAKEVEAVARLTRIGVKSTESETSIFVPAPLLTRANPSHDPDLWRSLFAQLRKNWIEDPSPFSISSLRLHIRLALKQSRRPPNFDELARDLSISRRTLSRKLASLQISFRTLVREERMTLARQMLEDRTKSVRAIARWLGYGNAATFSRAFRHQFGSSPTDWRDRNR